MERVESKDRLVAGDPSQVWNLIAQLLRKDAHVFERNGTWVYFGKHSGHLATLSALEAQWLSAFIQSQNPYIFVRDTSGDNDAEHFLLPLVKNITSRKVLTQSPVLPNSVQLHISDSCNMRCSYCYGEYHETKTHSKIMPISTALRAADFAAEIGAKDIGFFGGEPLLNLAVIKAFVAYATSHQYDFQYGITTNGTLITPAIAEYFAAHAFKVSVSIDGSSVNHDITRQYKNGNGSHADVLSGIDLLKKHKCLDMLEMTYSARHSRDLKAMLEYLAERCDFISCTCVEGKSNSSFTRDIVRGDRLRSYYKDMFDFVLEKRVNGEKVAVGGINELISSLLSDITVDKKYLCSTIMDRVSIAVDGTVYPCPETMKEPFSITNVLMPYTISGFEARWAVVLEKLTNEKLKKYWFSNLTDTCVARVSWDAGACSIEDDQAIGAALEDVLHRVATL